MAKAEVWTKLVAYHAAGETKPTWAFKAVPHVFYETAADVPPDGPLLPLGQVFHLYEVCCRNGYYKDRSAARAGVLFPYALIEVDQKLIDQGLVRPIAASAVPLECRLGIETLRGMRQGGAADVAAVFEREASSGTVDTAEGRTMLTRVLAQLQPRGLSKADADAIADEAGIERPAVSAQPGRI